MRRFGQVLVLAGGLAAILVLTLAVFRLPVGESLGLLLQGAFGNRFGISRTLVKMTPLLLCALGLMVAWRAGMYNIGGEGQFISGALLAATIVPLASALNPALLNVSLLVLGLVGGGIWAGIAGWLQVRRGVPVVISTILMNFIALQLLSWAVSGPLEDRVRNTQTTQPLPDAAMLMRFDRQMDLHSGVLLAVTLVAVLWLILYRTPWGFRLRFAGESPTAARANRIDAGKIQIQSMIVSGALCGLAGCVEYAGIAGQIGTGFAQNTGFLAIPVALLGALHPAGILGSSLYFGALFAGSENLARFTPSGTTIIYAMQAIAVLGFVALQAVNERRTVRLEAAS